MEYASFYNSILNITSCINIPVKLFTLYIVITKTPRHLRHDSFFILDVMSWNVLGNALLSIAHPLPVYAAQCFQIDGLLGHISDRQNVGFALFLSLCVCALHWGVGSILAFFYRYFSFVHPKLSAKIKPAWAFALGAFAHVSCMAAVFVLIFFANISYYKGPDTDGDLGNSHSLFCFSFPDWERPFIALAGILGFAMIITLAGLLFREISRSEGIVHAETLKIQRRLLWNLIILTSIVLLLGTIPLVITIFLVSSPNFPQADAIFMVSMIVFANHGGIYAIATLILFKPYRHAVYMTFRKRIRPSAVIPVKINVKRKEVI